MIAGSNEPFGLDVSFLAKIPKYFFELTNLEFSTQFGTFTNFLKNLEVSTQFGEFTS